MPARLNINRKHGVPRDDIALGHEVKELSSLVDEAFSGVFGEQRGPANDAADASLRHFVEQMAGLLQRPRRKVAKELDFIIIIVAVQCWVIDG